MEASTAAFVFIAFSALFLLWWVRWGKQRGFGNFTRYFSGSLLAIVVGITLTAIVETSFFGSQAAEANTTATNTPAAAPASIEQQRQAFLQYRAALFDLAAPSDSAHQELLQIMERAKARKATVYDIYAQAKRSLAVHETTWQDAGRLEIPAELQPYGNGLKQARNELADLIFERRQYTEAVMKVLDDPKPSNVQEVQERGDMMAQRTIRAGLAIAQVQVDLGITENKTAR